MSSNALPLVLGGVLLAGLAVAVSSKSSAAAQPTDPSAKTPPATPAPPKKRVPPRPSSEVPPMSVLERIVGAVASQDPARMRQVATEIEDDGWVIQADDLRRAADVAAFIKANGMKEPGTVLQGDPLRAPSRPQAWSPMPGVIAPQLSEPELHPKRLQAQMLVREMEQHPDGKEDRALVAAFQANNALKASGYYTPGTAICLAETYGLVPPGPYWPTSGRVKAKANYKQRLLAIADRDPQRAEEFRRAADKV